MLPFGDYALFRSSNKGARLLRMSSLVALHMDNFTL
jgi:hypothetical protein